MPRNQPESSLSIPVFDGSMMSIRTDSRSQHSSNIRYKSALPDSSKQNDKPEIRWKAGKLDKKYICNNCNTFLKFPVVFKDCHHRVCSICLTELLKTTSECPSCHEQIRRESVTVDHEYQREIQNLSVYCSNRQFGCAWEGIFKNHNVHFEECIFAKSEFNCEFCSVTLTKLEEIAHYNVCPKFMVPCPSNCGITEIRRENIQYHIDNECIKNDILCPFGDCGCTFRAQREDMPKHLKESPGVHLNLMCKAISLQKKQIQALTDIIDKQKTQLELLSGKVGVVEKYYGTHLIWKIENYQEKFAEAKSGKKPTIFSPPFLTSRFGYKLIMSASLNGDGKAKGKFMSLFVMLCKGDYDSVLLWPYNHKISVTLLDQNEDVEKRNHITYIIKPNACKENLAFLGKPAGERNAAFGAQKFVEQETINTNNYIAGDAIYLKVEVDTVDMFFI